MRSKADTTFPPIIRVRCCIDLPAAVDKTDTVGPDVPYPETFELDVLLRGYGVLLKKIQVEVISNFVAEKTRFFTVTGMRRCGVRFLHLDMKQQAQLEYFILNNTVDGFQGKYSGFLR